MEYKDKKDETRSKKRMEKTSISNNRCKRRNEYEYHWKRKLILDYLDSPI